MIGTVNEAVGVLIQAAEISTKQGIYNLSETKLIVEAIEFLIPDYFKGPQAQPTEPVQQPTEQPVDQDITTQEVDNTSSPKPKEYNL